MIGNFLWIVFWGVITFSLLVVLHEAGHFVAARAFGLKVHEFMVGLPGPRISYHGKKTTFGVTAIPLGGYVRIAGMEPGADGRVHAPMPSRTRHVSGARTRLRPRERLASPRTARGGYLRRSPTGELSLQPRTTTSHTRPSIPPRTPMTRRSCWTQLSL